MRKSTRGPGRPPKVQTESHAPSYGAGQDAGPAVAQPEDESRFRAENDWDREDDEALDQSASLHASRDQETPSEEAVHDDPHGDWSPPSLLEAPPPREGYTQRWIRVRRGNQEDWRNYNSRIREGWRPRDPSTVPRDFGPPTEAHGNFGSVIMVEGMILCEMDLRRAKQRKDFYARKLATQTQAVDEQLLKIQQAGHPIRRDAETRVTVGQRRPNVQADSPD